MVRKWIVLFLGIFIILGMFSTVQARIPFKENIGVSETIFDGLFQGSTYHYDPSSIVFNDFIVDVIGQMDETLYYGYLDAIVAFGTRVTGTPSCHDAGTYLYNEFDSMGLAVRYHHWTNGGYSDRNIEATLPGTNASSDQIFIIFGHYDTVSNCPGADDDASGVATVLAAAYILRQYAFDHTIRFVAFSGEEQWMLGSHEYVIEALNNGDNIVGVLNVDMIGFALNENQGSQVKVYKNAASLWLCDYTQNIGIMYHDYIGIDVIPLGEAPSDQWYFWQYGYDGLFYHELEFNYYYHTPQDTIENMNITYATKCSKLVLATLASLGKLSSNAPLTPQISGETNGVAGQSYDFTIISSDPDGDDIYYYFDWGDGSNSGWHGPYLSGDPTILSHTWYVQGDYEIRGKVKDVYNVESPWSDPLVISIVGGPYLDITAIEGGLFGVKTTIKNRGAAPASNVDWSIVLEGGAFLGKETQGTIAEIAPGEIVTVRSSPILGLGATKVTVLADIFEMTDERTQSGFVFLFLVLVNAGGG